ncbi:MAG: hypothetical protein HZC17_07130 [Candidatus Omnitrophica bacterium]|nr:hypothetical protein [Candidatus Omnitrophota bacterium]
MIKFLKLFQFAALLTLVTFVSSCAHHPRMKPIIKVPDFYDFRAQQNGLDIVVDPYEKPYKINYLFTTDITEKGILALHLIVWNNTNAIYNLESSKIVIRTVEGKEFSPLPPDQVSKKVLNNTVKRMMAYGAAGSALIFFTVPFAIAGGVDSAIANKNIRLDYEEKELRRAEIKPKSVFQGFLFFSLASSNDEIQSAFHRPYFFYLVGLKNESTGELLDVQIRFEIDHDSLGVLEK